MTAVPAGRRRDSDEPAVRQVTEDLVLVEVGGRKVLAAALCPHRGGRLKYGRVDGDRLRITCPLHHTTFDLSSGERLSGAACAVAHGDVARRRARDAARRGPCPGQ
ncbi:Rieske 2Fe-2S domain-containing protein, partial [Streptomyces sp. NPDC039028]|uniref:Rieske (2Fe-2S) protein n=1 Tax=Streptomyces sp. NPDC039028 TaxID=3155370 RepID=UPI0033E9FAD8